MKKLLLTSVLLGAACAGAQSVTVGITPAQPVSMDFGVTVGTYNGGSIEGFLIGRNLGGSNIGVRGSFALSGAQGFNANEQFAPGVTAGDVFYAGVGTTDPDETARNITLSLDAMIGLGFDPTTGIGGNVYVGPRYNLFSDRISGPDGSFTAAVNAFGIGAGAIGSFRLVDNLFVVGDLGVDHYFAAPFTFTNNQGDRQTVAPNEGGYEDLDRVFNQPQTVLKARVGLALRY